MKVFKSIIIQNDQDCAIIKHHIQELDMMFECKFNECIIDFYDQYLYSIIKEFMTRTKIKSKIYKGRTHDTNINGSKI